jgi:hypothetical protein
MMKTMPSSLLLLTISLSNDVGTQTAAAFSTVFPSTTQNGVNSRTLTQTTTSLFGVEPEIEDEEMDVAYILEIEEAEACRPSQYGKKISEAIPFLECPKVLRESTLAGNMGFDPLQLAQNQEQLLEYREAEVKHSRLAMLAAVGWPVSELSDRTIASYFNAPTTLDEGDRVPSVLNGGLDRIDPRFWGFCLGLTAAIDLYGVSKSRRGNKEYFPGNIGFDPLGLFPAHKQGQENMKLAEIKHGRTAMVGVVGYVVEEYVTKMAVVDDTPALFQPISETVEEALSGIIVL